jgi:Haem-binding domain
MKPSRTLTMLCFPPVLVVVAMLARERHVNPRIDPARSIQASMTVPARIQDLLSRACFDCHSSETHWPWYASLPMVSHAIEGDVMRGRAAMNFSDWASGAGGSPGRAAGTLMAACTAVEQNRMPKPPYSYVHPQSWLTQQDTKMFCDWAREQARLLQASRK